MRALQSHSDRLFQVDDDLLDLRLGYLLETVLSRLVAALQQIGFRQDLDLSTGICLCAAEVSGYSRDILLALKKEFEYFQSSS
jgi:hypothetical protein